MMDRDWGSEFTAVARRCPRIVTLRSSPITAAHASSQTKTKQQVSIYWKSGSSLFCCWKTSMADLSSEFSYKVYEKFEFSQERMKRSSYSHGLALQKKALTQVVLKKNDIHKIKAAFHECRV